MSNRFVRLLESAFEVIAVLVEKGSGTFSAKHPPGCSNKRPLTHFLKERVINEAEISRIGDTAYAKAIAAATSGRAFSAEPMLFPDPGGNGVRIKHKPKHRIRAYRRVAKKGSTVRFAEQGSLFESQYRSAKTA
jgi:hypothetical protein